MQRSPLDGAPAGGGGGTLPQREATELLDCVRIMGAANAAWCREQVLGETAAPTQPLGPPTRELVWGVPVTRAACGCEPQLRQGARDADRVRDAYRACDDPSFTTSDEVEACVDARLPGFTVAAETSPSGTMSLPPPAADPCERLAQRGTRVHEVFHARQAERIARGIGGAFYTEWQRLAGRSDRLDALRASFPSEVARFESEWDDPSDWVRDEVESYTWERRFLTDVVRALGRICP